MCIVDSNHSVVVNKGQIVMSVCKVGWMTITKMPCDNTHNHGWRVAHQISLHAQQMDRWKSGKRNTMDHVHFEC